MLHLKSELWFLISLLSFLVIILKIFLSFTTFPLHISLLLSFSCVFSLNVHVPCCSKSVFFNLHAVDILSLRILCCWRLSCASLRCTSYDGLMASQTSTRSMPIVSLPLLTSHDTYKCRQTMPHVPSGEKNCSWLGTTVLLEILAKEVINLGPERRNI